MRAPVPAEPETVLYENPFGPVIVQLSTLVADHVTVEVLPERTEPGLAAILNAGFKTVTPTEDCTVDGEYWPELYVNTTP